MSKFLRFSREEESDAPRKSLLGPLDEFQGRFNLEVPKSYIKEERSREASDFQTATHTIVWYDTENMKDSDREEDSIDLEPIIEEIAASVLGSKDYLDYSVSHTSQGRHKFQTTISVNFKAPPSTVASLFFRRGQDLIPAGDYPVSLYIGDDVFSIDTTDGGISYRITENGEAVEEGYDSAPMAFGRLITEVIGKLESVEGTQGRDDLLTVEQEVLIGMSKYFLDSEVIPEDAKIHLIDFVEFVTNRDLEAQLDPIEEENEDSEY